eukprot:2056459-Amphidinium_carterae.1
MTTSSTATIVTIANTEIPNQFPHNFVRKGNCNGIANISLGVLYSRNPNLLPVGLNEVRLFGNGHRKELVQSITQDFKTSKGNANNGKEQNESRIFLVGNNPAPDHRM